MVWINGKPVKDGHVVLFDHITGKVSVVPGTSINRP